MNSIDRRMLMTSAGAASLATLLPLASQASPDAMAAAIHKALGGAMPKPGRVKIDITPLAENGNSVPIVITADSPMTAADHVKTIYVFSPENPAPDVVRFYLGPRAGRARVQTSIRLATTQRIYAVAVMADGSAWSDSAEVIVTLSACLDAG
jgi:sulfur-oxidizing protein SoxY